MQFLQQHADRVHGGHHHPLGLYAAYCLPHHPRHGSLTQPSSLFARRHHQRCCAVVRARGVPGGHRAIGLKGGPEFGQYFQRRIRARGFIRRKLNGVAFLLLDGDGNNFIDEAAVLDSVDGAAMAFHGVGILVLAGDTVFFGHQLARHPHVEVFVRVP